MYKIKSFNTADVLKEDQIIYESRSKEGSLEKGEKYRLIDLFAGAGGMSLGFSERFRQPFTSVWANDFNEYCVKTYKHNFGADCISGNIIDILNNPKTKIPKADVVIGGPPCQGFSLLNKQRENDPRNQLWRPFMEIVEKSGASIFVMENVPQLLGTYEHGEIDGFAEKMGFYVWHGKLTASDYGVPQKRVRAFIIGCKFYNPALVFPPRKTHYNPKAKNIQYALPGENIGYLPSCKKWKTVRDALGDLPETVGTEIRNVSPPLDLHFGRNPTQLSIDCYRAIPKEGMNRFDLQKVAPELTPDCWIRKKTGSTDLFGRLWWHRPTFTIRKEFYRPEKGCYLHQRLHDTQINRIAIRKALEQRRIDTRF
jgi:DNA (cytosine-5)-methyltransferase 1